MKQEDLKQIDDLLQKRIDNSLQTHIKPVQEEVAVLHKKLDDALLKHIKPMKEDIVKIRKDMNTIVNFFDREYLDLRKRVERIEDLLDIKQSN